MGSAVRAGGSRATRRSGRRARAGAGAPARGCAPATPPPRSRRCRGRGTRRPGAAPPSPGSRGCRPPRRPQQPLDLGGQLGATEPADARVVERPARIRVGEGRAQANAVEASDGTVSVVADRHPPAALLDELANRVAIVAHVQREEAHAITVAPVERVEDVLLVDALVAAFAEPEAEHEGAVEEVADADRVGAPDPAGRGATGVLRARHLGGLAIVLGDVGVAFQRAGRDGDGELRQRPARRQLVEAESAAVLVADLAQQGDDDHGPQQQAHDRRVAVPHRLSSAQSRRAGRATITAARAAVRSITVTMPKSRSIRTSLTTRTAKPTIAVTPEARTAAPVRP